MADGIPERLNRLAGQGAPRLVRQRYGHHHRNGGVRLFVEHLFHGEQSRLGVQRIENRFQQNQVHPTFQHSQHLFPVGLPELVEIHGPEARIIHVRRQGAGDGHGADGAGHKAGPAVARLRLVAGAAGQGNGGQVHIPHQGLQNGGIHHLLEVGLVLALPLFRMMPEIVVLPDAGCAKGTGFNDIRTARIQKAAVHVQNHLRPGQHEKVVVVLQVVGIQFRIREALSPVILLLQLELLDISAHGAVQDYNPFAQLIFEIIKTFESGCFGHKRARKIYSPYPP